MSNASRKRQIFALTFLAIVLLDRFTKQMVVNLLPYGDTYCVGGGNLLWFQHISNPGMAFGIEFFPSWFLAAVKSIAVIALGYYLIVLARVSLWQGIPLSMIMGGAMGNLIDRLRGGEVIDFISVDTPDFLMRRFYTFNIADSAVFCGVSILILITVFSRDTESPPEQFPPPPAPIPPPIEDS